MLHNQWYRLIREEFEKDYFKKLQVFLQEEEKQYAIYPAKGDRFHALEVTDYEDVKVVIIGQDPYHGEGQAHGLSFSVQKGVRIPPSLRNIFKELHADVGVAIPSHGNLEYWAKQGVLLLNTVLTVRQGEANAHKGKGWETFTDKVISLLNERQKPIIFVLWGRPAQQKRKMITNSHHIILESVHPSPLSASRGFFGSKPFSAINNTLRQLGEAEIDWGIPE
ncbi:uracil-DNA glycosylase [Priestia taiwanensis]|uniref:Uracil-DNA glycosylase n=1 Tax=Priestia taiwanensis TaxID=1347902 RepID=A0A917AWX0_9BACI|nr:uracil-DNA glycosylase [Priestia taiwanensis]MBM7364929.1 uracil-DNA glycosylase [Priestia taiwanensis]GGE82493.1 uracil-DNA glycosylase [Priestia taiwanensis]